MEFGFRNRIVLGAGRLQSADSTCTLREPATGRDTVTLRALRGGGDFTAADWLLLEGEGYPSSDAAFNAGKRWRQQLSVAFARVAIAADFDPLPLPDREATDRPASPEAPGLVVFPKRGGLTVRVEMWGEAVVHQPLESFLSLSLSPVLESLPDGLDRRLELAYTTYHAALATSAPELSYVLYVTALEALIDDDRQRPEAILGAIQMLSESVNQSTTLTQSTKDRLGEILREDEKESISQVGRELAAQLSGTYGGKEPSAFFSSVYGRRSRIMHGALRFTGRRKRPSLQDIQDEIPELRRFVFDILSAESGAD